MEKDKVMVGYWEGQEVEYKVREGSAIIDECIAVPLEEIEEETSGPSFGVVSSNWEERLWGKGVISYEFDEDIPEERKELIESAIEEWNEETITKFRPREGNDVYRLVFRETSGSSSSEVGRRVYESNVNVPASANWNAIEQDIKRAIQEGWQGYIEIPYGIKEQDGGVKSEIERAINEGSFDASLRPAGDDDRRIMWFNRWRPISIRHDAEKWEVLHEMAHAAGLHHEHFRSDRSDYLVMVEISVKYLRKENGLLIYEVQKDGERLGEFSSGYSPHYENLGSICTGWITSLLYDTYNNRKADHIARECVRLWSNGKYTPFSPPAQSNFSDVGYYDLDSVMHYRFSAWHSDDDEAIIYKDDNLSPGDIQTVWELYKKEATLLRVPMATIDNGRTDVLWSSDAFVGECRDVEVASDWIDEGRCFVFDGEKSKVFVHNIACPQEFTYSAWVKRDVDLGTGYRALIDFDPGPFFGFYNGRIGISNGGIAPDEFAVGWHHVAATYDGTVARVYVDGEEVMSVPKDYGAFAEGVLRLGYGTSTGEFFKGRMAEVIVLTKALSKFAVRRLMVNTCMMLNGEGDESLRDAALFRSDSAVYFFKEREYRRCKIADKAAGNQYNTRNEWSGWPEGFVPTAAAKLAAVEVFFGKDQDGKDRCFERVPGGPNLAWGPGTAEAWYQKVYHHDLPEDFRDIQAAFSIDGVHIWLFQDDEVLISGVGGIQRKKLTEVFQYWPSNFVKLDCALYVKPENKAYFFKDRRCIIVDIVEKIVETRPTPEIVDIWPSIVSPAI